ncbi:MAG TPA: HAMP domain-containing sensor histidine kinase [Nannocystaceae bacterium]|nr:HAMP domain-containing sensor histidine kinase [Nannocystaceae bacterium]
MISALLGALAVAFVGCGVALRSETGQQDRDPRFCRVVAWLIGGYLALAAMTLALPGAGVARAGRGAAALVLVMALVAWTVGTRHVAVRTRLRLALIGCAAIVLVHELPWPWPMDVRAQIERAHPWSFIAAVMVSAAVVGASVAQRWLLDRRALALGLLAHLVGWGGATLALALADVPAPGAVAAFVVFALAGAVLAVEAVPRTSKVPSAVRETLPAVALLTDPEAVRRRMAEGLRSLFPGSAIEVYRLRGAPQTVLPHSREVSRALADAAAKSGALLIDDAASLPGALAQELGSFGRGVVIPILFDELSFGVLHVDHARPTTEMIVVARRFADLLGHRIETQRLGHELDAQRRIAALGAVAAAVVHDLRSPLSSVRLNLQVATATEPRLAKDPGLVLAHAELARVEAMLGGLLDLGRPRGAARDRIDVRDAAKTAVERSTARAGALGMRLELDAASSSAVIRGDRERLVRTVGNLIDNALDASDENGLVRVATRVAGDMVSIEVTDRGSGDAAALREQAAFSFSTSKPKGCGLGLLIVRDTAEAYGGRLDFVRVEPRGVTARITVPTSTGGDA